MKVHAVVADLGTARRAARGGATVVQIRLKGASTAEVVAFAEALGPLPEGVRLVVNDDLEAALRLGAGVHLGRDDPGWERARRDGLLLGLSATTVAEAVEAAAGGCDYLGVGPVWATPSKVDAAPPLGLEGLAEACVQVDVPVVAIGGVDAGNAAACVRAGAAGVAVVRAVAEIERLRAVVDEALGERDAAR